MIQDAINELVGILNKYEEHVTFKLVENGIIKLAITYEDGLLDFEQFTTAQEMLDWMHSNLTEKN